LAYGGLRASGLSMPDDSYGNDGPIDLPEFDRFDAGPMVAGPGGAPSQTIKVGASAAWRGHQEAIYGALDDLNAAVSTGEQDRNRLIELRNGALDTLNSRRIAMQTDPAVMREILDRGLTSKNDLEKLGMLGAFGDTDTVHRIAVATAQAGGAGNATAQGIASQLAQYEGFGPAFMSRIPGDAAIEAAAPGMYLNTLLSMRGHVDSTMMYVASMSGDQMAQLGRYTDTVMDQGGMTRYQDNEKLGGMFSSMQATGAGIARVGEGLSVVGIGLRNVANGFAMIGPRLDSLAPDVRMNPFPPELSQGVSGVLPYKPYSDPNNRPAYASGQVENVWKKIRIQMGVCLIQTSQMSNYSGIVRQSARGSGIWGIPLEMTTTVSIGTT
jgi:hypothetical protein